MKIKRKKKIYAANEGLFDQIDNIANAVEDIQEDIDEVSEDRVDIELDNNISNHYVAECDLCQGIFISAVVQSDQEVESISGICPLCDRESNQYLKWIVKDVSKADDYVPKAPKVEEQTEEQSPDPEEMQEDPTGDEPQAEPEE
jgi:hypothetical protein